MEGLLKTKHHHRRKRKPEKATVTGAEQDHSGDRSTEREHLQCHVISHAHSHDGHSGLAGHSSPGIEIQNCSQFIEHEPAVVWGSPQVSPSSGYEQNDRIIDLVTPPQEKPSRKKPAVVSKPARKLMPAAVSPSFLTKLMGLSEQYKDDEEQDATESSQPVKNPACDRDFIPSKSLNDNLNQKALQKVKPDAAVAPVNNYEYDMLFADDDDDVIVKCTQQIEETISESECKKHVLSDTTITHKPDRKLRQIQVNEIKPSSRHSAHASKLPVKFPCAKNTIAEQSPLHKITKGRTTGSKNHNSTAEQSPLHKVTKARTPGSAKYYKDGVFLGYGSRKSPRTKKNIFASLNSVSHQEVCNDSFESALQTFVDDDYAFLDVSAGKELNKNAVLSDEVIKKRPSTGVDSRQQSASTKMSAHHSEIKNLQNVCNLPLQQTVSMKTEQTDAKSKAGNSNKRSTGYPDACLTKNGDTTFETVALEDDAVNETELVNVLEIVESQVVPSSPPLRCTPEEIQRKRIEAKQKLAKKKLNSSNKTCPPSVIKPKR